MVARLLNNDADDGTSVDVDFNVVGTTPESSPLTGAPTPALWPTAAPRPANVRGVNAQPLSDVTSAFDVSYGATGRDGADRFNVNVNVTISGQLDVRDTLLLAVRGLRNQTGGNSTAQVRGYDGLLPFPVAGLEAGTPYFDLSHLLPKDEFGYFLDGSAANNVLLSFLHSQNLRFDYDFVLLGGLNRPPVFTSDPYIEPRGQAYPMAVASPSDLVLEVVAGKPFAYQPTTSDPDSDAVTVSLIGGPTAATYNATPGVLSWTPGTGDVGTHQFRLRATDSHGLFDPANDQTFTVRVVTGVGNRAPYFLNTPITTARANELYRFESGPFDPDGDSPLEVSAEATYQEGTITKTIPSTLFVIGQQNGIVTWTPTDALYGKRVHVVLTVKDTFTPKASGTLAYDIDVLEGAATRGAVDLTIENLAHDAAQFDPQRLTVTGVMTAVVANSGPGLVKSPFRVTFFEDLDFDGVFNPARDTTLGSIEVTQQLESGATITVAASLAGQVQFAGAVIRAFVDSNNDIPETNEGNNYAAANDECMIAPVVGQFNPVIEWSRQGENYPYLRHLDYYAGIDYADYNWVDMTPLVGDINKDGVPDIVVVTSKPSHPQADANLASGPTRALDGATGAELWTNTATSDLSRSVFNPDNFVGYYRSPSEVDFSYGGNGLAIGDLDGDGYSEIVAPRRSDGRWVVFDHNGLLKSDFTGPSLAVRPLFASWEYPAIADLDGDGYGEIITPLGVVDRHGNVLWHTPSDWTMEVYNPIPVVTDLDGVTDANGHTHPEVIYGSYVFNYDGTPYTRTPDDPWTDNINDMEAFVGVANMDTDPDPELVVVQQGYLNRVCVVEGHISRTTDIPGLGESGPPTIADFDGDGKMEIGIAGSLRYRVIDDDGTIK